MSMKKIAVLGGGNGAHTIAADLVRKGHMVNLFEMPQFKDKIAQVFETKEIEVTGSEHWIAKLNMVTDDIDQAIQEVDYIIILTPAFAHAAYGKLLKGRVKKDQVIITMPGAFASLELRKIFADEKEIPVFADVNNLPYDTRLIAPGKVALYGRNKVNIAFLPATAGETLFEQLREDILPFERTYQDVLECGLSIVNPSWHTGPCMLSVTAIEDPKVNFFIYEHGWSPSACKVNIAIDRERKAVGQALGYHLRPHEDFTGMSEDYTWQDLYKEGHGAISLTPICGPNNISDRYLTEDCPYGLVPWSSIGNLVGVDTPVMNASITVYNILHERDWKQDGLTVDDLGIAGMDKEHILRYVRTGEY